MSLSAVIGARYTRSRAVGGYVSVVSLVSFLGLVLGVVALIVVISVMNGFDRELRNRILSAVPHMIISGTSAERVREVLGPDNVLDASRFQEAQLLMTAPGGSSLVVVHGVEPGATELFRGSPTVPRTGPAIVLGESAARRLGLLQGDRIRLIVPGLSESGRTLQPRIVSVELSHTFRLGSELDYSLAFMDVDDLTAITGRPADLRLTVHDLLEAPLHARQLNMAGIQAHDWTMRYGDFFRAVRMEKIMMFVLLSFVIAVASFSIVSGLSMLVDSKRRDIAVLRTMGMSERGVLGIFVIQGMLVAGLGVFVGLLLGLPLAVYAPEIMDFIYQFFGFSIIEGTYFDRIPTDVRTADVTSVILVALVISFVATLYPAIRAARLDPAAVLRYE